MSDLQDKIGAIARNFKLNGEFMKAERYLHGHINETYVVYCDKGYGMDIPNKYILQKINVNVFKEPVKLMENITAVCKHIAKKAVESGGDPLRESISIIETTEGNNLYIDSDGNFWRAYIYIDNAATYQQAVTKELFRESGVAFGLFQMRLADFPAEILHESIPDFHNTAKRFKALEIAISQDIAGRAKDVKAEIEFAMNRKQDASILVDLLEAGELPLKVTHNDTKLNNVMFDISTGKAVCVVDLDTVMPGLSLYDFGDSIRFGASTADEDERDLDKVSMSMELFKLYSEGFLSQARPSMTEKELEYMPMGAKIITFECGIRFLTDYLNGDTYFQIHRPGQNLDRCRTQFKLVKDMENKMDEMRKVIL